jgi:hypothetical protein
MMLAVNSDAPTVPTKIGYSTGSSLTLDSTPLAFSFSQDQSSLSVEQLVHVLGCFGSLGGIYQLPQGPALLLAILQRVLEGLQAVQPK